MKKLIIALAFAALATACSPQGHCSHCAKGGAHGEKPCCESGACPHHPGKPAGEEGGHDHHAH